MARSFPVSLPGGFGRGPSIVAQSFSLLHATTTQAEGGGGVAAARLGQPRWVSELQTGTLADPHLREWRAWLEEQAEGVGRFYLPDLSRRRPAAYPGGVASLTRAGGGAFDGTVAWSVDSSRTVVSLSTLPSGLVLTAGDLLGFRWAVTRRAVVAATVSVTANPSGVAVLDVAPFVPLDVPADAVCSLLDAEIVARVTPGSVDAPSVTRGNRGTVRFRAEEDRG